MKLSIRLGLGIAGMPEQTINDLDAALPAMLRLLELYRTQLSPLIAKAKPDLDAVAPVLEEVIKFMEGL